jgi:hypothetical protein
MLELVVWRDAFEERDRGGMDVDSLKDEYLVQTVGFVVGDGPLFLRLAQEVLPDDDGYRAVTSIPLAGIVRRVPLLEVSLVPPEEWGPPEWEPPAEPLGG